MLEKHACILSMRRDQDGGDYGFSQCNKIGLELGHFVAQP